MAGVHIDLTVLIRGGGEMASGCAHRLFRSGFRVGILELAQPLAIRRAVAFAEAVPLGRGLIEGVAAIKAETLDDLGRLLVSRAGVPVAVDPEGRALAALRPDVLVDARMAKTNLGVALTDAPLVVGLGPGFVAGKDVHAVIETERGHDLGRVIWEGPARNDTGEPYPIRGITTPRVLRAPCAGELTALAALGDLVAAGEVVARVGETPVVAQTSGLLRGLVRSGVEVRGNMKIGDIDPRGAAVDFRLISDKARAIAGGLLEAILSRWNGPPVAS
jgi:xanthine dehydrogenase accessory factor